MTELTVAVVVLSKDEPSVAETLALLRAQCEELGAKCLVIDASEGRLEAIASAHTWVEWVNYEKPFWRRSSIPHQRNLGVEMAGTDIIAFCDAGGRPSPQWLRSIVDSLSNHSQMFVCGPIFPTSGEVLGVTNNSPTGTVASFAPTANVAFFREAFDLVHGFDERFDYGSDTFFQHQLKLHKVPCYVVNDARMDMPWGEAGKDFKRSWRWGRGAGRNFRFRTGHRIAFLRQYLALSAWILIAVYSMLTIVASLALWQWWPFVAWTFLALCWIIKNRSTKRLAPVALDHLIQAIAFSYDVILSLLQQSFRIGFIGYEESEVRLLVRACTKAGSPATVLKYSNSMNLTWKRLRGVRLIVVRPSRDNSIIRLRRLVEFTKFTGLVFILDLSSDGGWREWKIEDSELNQFDGVMSTNTVAHPNCALVTSDVVDKSQALNRLASQALIRK